MIEAELRAARERAMVLEEPVAKKPRAVSEQTPVSQMVVEVLQREEERQVVEPAEEQKLQQAAEHQPEKERGDEGGRAAEVADEAKRAAEVTAAGADVEHQQEEVKQEIPVIDMVKMKATNNKTKGRNKDRPIKMKDDEEGNKDEAGKPEEVLELQQTIAEWSAWAETAETAETAEYAALLAAYSQYVAAYAELQQQVEVQGGGKQEQEAAVKLEQEQVAVVKLEQEELEQQLTTVRLGK